MKLNIKLTNKQKRHISTVRWLLTNRRDTLGTGRSTVMAYIFLEMAIKCLDDEIYIGIRIFDHTVPTVRFLDEYFIHLIIKMCPQELAVTYNKQHQTIKVTRKNKK